MTGLTCEIVLCPPQQRQDAVALALSEIAPSQRPEIAGKLLADAAASEGTAEALYVAIRDGGVYGACWGQRQPGNTAVLWPPRMIGPADSRWSLALTESVVCHLDAAGVAMTQALLPSHNSELVPILSAAGFAHLSDLVYLSCEAEFYPLRPPHFEPLRFQPYHFSDRARLMKLVERTYEGTLDCAGLNGMRRMDDVIDGYQQTGVFRPDNWLLARNDSRDVGVLLVAEHPRARHFELMYMGLVPEVRGRGWGQQLARQALWLAKSAGVERVVLAVDAENSPALATYERVGFAMWDRRSVYVRFLHRERT
jgi:ribosomal protein S18 acetylase RimI-like enzyme